MAKLPTMTDHKSRWDKVRANRWKWQREATIDLRFEAGNTWTEDEKRVFDNENRVPTNYNLIRPLLKLIVGLEAQARQDHKVLPRTQKDSDVAQALTKILKFVSDQNNFGRVITLAFEDALKVGIGWLEVGYNPDPTREELMIRHEDSFNIWIDNNARELDLDDAEDIFRAKWMKPQKLAELFPKYKGQILSLRYDRDMRDLNHSSDYTNDFGDYPPMYRWGEQSDYMDMNPVNELVQAVERWYRVEEMADFWRFPDGRTLEINEENAEQIAQAVVSNQGKKIRAIARRIRVALFVGDILLQDSPSPYKHARFPFVPIWAYMDEHHRPMGLVRQLRDPQKEFNSRRTHLLKRALNRQVLYETGSLIDAPRASQQFAKHNALIEVAKGALTDNRVQIRDDLASAPTEVQLLENAMQMIQDWSGVTKEALGQETNAESGVAIARRQAQGQTSLYTLFDYRNWAQEQVGEMLLSLIQDTFTQEQSFRITDGIRGLQWITVNQPHPSGIVLNDITQGRYDVIVEDVPAHVTDQLAQAEALMDFLHDMPPPIKLAFAQDIAQLQGMPEEMIAKMGHMLQQMGLAPPPTGQPGQQGAAPGAPSGTPSPGGAPPPPQGSKGSPAPGLPHGYNDAPEDIKRQMEHASGYEPSVLPPESLRPQPPSAPPGGP